MSTVATLTIEMAANLARLQSDMNQTKGMVGGAMKEVAGAADFAKKALGALGVSLSVGAFATMIKGAIDSAAALDDLAKTTGVSASQLSALERVGVTTGTTANDLAGMLTKLAKNMVDVEKPSSKAGQALKALGISAEDFRKLKPDEQMLAVAKATEKFADGGAKAAAVEALLGKGAAERIPYLKDLAQQTELVAVWTDEQAASADGLMDNMALLKASSGDYVKTLTGGMLPALQQGSQAFLDVFNQSGGLRDQLKKLVTDGSIERWTRAGIVGLTYLMDIFAGVKRVVQSVGEYFGAVAAQITIFFSSVGAAAKRFFTGDFAGALEEVKGGMRQADAVAADLRNTLGEVWSAETTGQKIRARLDEVKQFGQAAEAVKPALDYREVHEGNAKAAAKESEQLREIEIYRKKIKEAEIENIEIYRKKIELSDETTRIIKEQEAAANAWQASMDSVFSGLTDALFRAFDEGKGFMEAFRDTLKNTFNTLVLRPTIEAIMRPIAGALGGVMTGARAGLGGIIPAGGAAGGGGGGILGGLGNLGTAIGIGGSMLGAGLGYGLAAYGASATLGGTLAGAGAMISGGLAGGMAGIGSTLAGVGAMLGAVAPIAAAVYAIWKGFSRGPKVVKESGITGTVVGGDATAQLYEKWKQSGGWIVGDRKGTRYKDLGEEMSAGLDMATAGVYGQMAEWTKAVGLPAEQLADVTHSISIKLGKDDAETQKNIEAALDGYRQALAGRFAAALEPFRNAGDTLAETLERLVGIQAMSEQLNQFGGVFSRVAQLSVEAREELIGFAGGIEALIAKTQSFVSAYYSEGEQAAIAAKQIREALGALGISADISSKSDFRALVEATDVATTEGRQALNTLLSLAPSFAQVADYIAKSGGTLGELAGSAPQIAVLEAMFSENQAATQYAEQTAAGVAAVETAVTASGDNIVAALGDLQASLGARLAAVEEAIQRNSRDVVGALEALPA